MVVITMGDQAHNNLPDVSFTGGRITFLGGPELLQGDPGPMTMIPWKTWKLRRVAISSDDAEIQAMVESEDNNFRTRLLWSELNGAGVDKDINDLMQHADLAVSSVSGIVATDSKGGFDCDLEGRTMPRTFKCSSCNSSLSIEAVFQPRKDPGDMVGRWLALISRCFDKEEPRVPP